MLNFPSNFIQNNEFSTTRRYLRRVPDRNPFISATILLLLEQCKNVPESFAPQLAAVKAQIANYQKDHLTFHWPLVNGEARLANAPFLSRFSFLSLSADADCSVLQIMALNQSEHVNALCKELTYYRADEGNFSLVSYQKIIPNWQGSFLTWFPKKSKKRKVESIDLAVNANILWFLSHFKKLGSAGALESLNSILATLKTNLIIEKPYYLSPYYPKPLLILYMISRAADFGNIAQLLEAKAPILRLRAKCQEAKNSLEALLHSAILAHLGEIAAAKEYFFVYKSFKKKEGMYYCSPQLELQVRALAQEP
jgi:hypothetical protein